MEDSTCYTNIQKKLKIWKQCQNNFKNESKRQNTKPQSIEYKVLLSWCFQSVRTGAITGCIEHSLSDEINVSSFFSSYNLQQAQFQMY